MRGRWISIVLGYWNANSIPGDRKAWTCRAGMRYVKVAAAAAGPGRVSCSLRHPTGKLTATIVP